MLSVDEAQRALLAHARPLPAETVTLADAAGRFTATDIAAKLTQPPFDASSMDGYAIRWADLPGPWRVIGESAAGRRFAGPVGTGEAVRIFTGAPLPPGADTVVIQEEIARDGDDARILGDGSLACGAHIRPMGLDFMQGTPLVPAGTRLISARLGLLAAAGHGSVAVHRRPRVVLLATGDELVEAGEIPGPDGIVSSNGPMLAALLRAAGADVRDGGIVPDTFNALDAALANAANADLIVTVGGASVGDYDLVVPALQARGASIDFWKVAMRPGKPMLAGTLGGATVIGLPGNPVSAFVCATLFALPVVRALLGDRDPLPTAMLAEATVDLPANDSRRDHLRATLALVDGAWRVTPAARQDSSMLSVLAAADALLVRPEHAAAAPAGTAVPVISLDSAIRHS